MGIPKPLVVNVQTSLRTFHHMGDEAEVRYLPAVFNIDVKKSVWFVRNAHVLHLDKAVRFLRCSLFVMNQDVNGVLKFEKLKAFKWWRRWEEYDTYSRETPSSPLRGVSTPPVSIIPRTLLCKSVLRSILHDLWTNPSSFPIRDSISMQSQ